MNSDSIYDINHCAYFLPQLVILIPIIIQSQKSCHWIVSLRSPKLTVSIILPREWYAKKTSLKKLLVNVLRYYFYNYPKFIFDVLFCSPLPPLTKILRFCQALQSWLTHFSFERFQLLYKQLIRYFKHLFNGFFLFLHRASYVFLTIFSPFQQMV